LSDGAKQENAGQDDASKQAEAHGISPDCRNHFGYLSERSLKQRIPDECMTCKEIVHCMLKKTLE
jgi:PP-loop superfamily ATP-utilizing enzyme